MRLFLSSERLGSAPEEYVALFGPGRRVGLVAAGAYLDDPERRRARIDDELAELGSLGLDPVEVDLADPGALEVLGACDGVWVMGGDAEALREALDRSGASDLIRERLTADTLVYGGYSAGACVLGPTFPGRELRPVDGLGLVAFTVAPHTRPDSTGWVEWCTAHGVPHLALADGQAVVVDGDTQRGVGPDEGAVWTVAGERFRVRRAPDGQVHCDWLSGPDPGYGFTIGAPSTSLRFHPASEPAPPAPTETPDWVVERHIEGFLEGIDPQNGHLAD
ncbi:type 1 glutamine amidotransferase-like domain-containing protein [Nocardioides anomalus]|uniref:Type 1 glutamine amidotransferase-like domain-containing protein n=1 Tax=Nocardioides anomalus TaxID=2712223 RepID=A0A6G6WD47_9ACTN|nr:Type 1 glutamine amidotransferase-like domain-containing protein [Nocardioides anomalus]QIG43271.1 type 1 glutamine amidotransferase-like domain-containing protein [Nocardioides anomalus]